MRLCDARQREKMCDDLSQTAVSKTMLCVYERKNTDDDNDGCNDNYDGFDDDDDNARRCEDMTSPRQIQFNSMEWNGIDQWVLVKM